VQLFQGRLARLNDFVDWADFFFLDDPVIDEAAAKRYLTQDLSKEFKLFVQRLDSLQNFNITNIESTFRELVAQLGIEAKELIHPIRLALTGKTVGPGLFEVIYYLGKERSKRRLLKWVK
jgi:glutamyl-tRNA synthetase